MCVKLRVTEVTTCSHKIRSTLTSIWTLIFLSGEESVTRGCTKNQEQLPLLCKTPSLTVQHKRYATGQFQIDCCSGDLCNHGDFPDLPPMYTEDMSAYSESLMYALKLTGAVLGPVLVFTILGVIVMYFLRRYYRKR